MTRSGSAFGLTLATDIDLPGAWADPTVGDHAIVLVIDESVPQALPGGQPEWSALIDGSPLTLERGIDGSFLFRHATGRHHLAADLSTLRCAPLASGILWMRVLLDSVLFCTALLRGGEALHAGAIQLGDAAVAIVAGAGGGKSTLLAELAGGESAGLVMTDDITFLRASETGRIDVLPGPPVMTLARGQEATEDLEDVLLTIGDEAWVTTDIAKSPAPLRAVVVLERRAGRPLDVRPAPDAARVLLGALLALPDSATRAAARLDLAAAVAAQCPVVRLTANTETAPDQLAAALAQALPLR